MNGKVLSRNNQNMLTNTEETNIKHKWCIKNVNSFKKYEEQNKETLIVKYVGIYEINNWTYFVFMKNIFKIPYKTVYNLKRVTVIRKVKTGIWTEKDYRNKTTVENKEKIIKKTNLKNSNFLKSLNLMDYSLVMVKNTFWGKPLH